MNNIFGDKQIKVIRHAGDLNEITLEDGVKVRRSLSVFVDKNIGTVRCAPYDNHFVFSHVFNDRGWTTWCTCGSPAGVVGYDAYKKDASKQGEMLVCLFHAGITTGQSGKHANGDS